MLKLNLVDINLNIKISIKTFILLSLFFIELNAKDASDDENVYYDPLYEFYSQDGLDDYYTLKENSDPHCTYDIFGPICNFTNTNKVRNLCIVRMIVGS